MLLHGFTGDASTMAGVAEPIAASGRPALVPDLIGHGRSDAPADPAPYGFAAVVGQVAEIATALADGPIDVVGYSMGGRIGLGLAVERPDIVRSLCMIGGSPGLADAADRSARVESDEQLARRIESDGIESFVDFWMNLPLFATQMRLPASLRDAMRDQRLRCDPTGLAMSLRGSGTGSMPPLHRALKDIDVPTLWMAGELDTKFSDIARAAAGVNDRFEAVLIDDASHAAHIEQPEAVAAEIVRFLTDV